MEQLELWENSGPVVTTPSHGPRLSDHDERVVLDILAILMQGRVARCDRNEEAVALDQPVLTGRFNVLLATCGKSAVWADDGSYLYIQAVRHPDARRNARIAALAWSGMPYADIASEFWLSSARVGQIANENGVRRKHPRDRVEAVPSPVPPSRVLRRIASHDTGLQNYDEDT